VTVASTSIVLPEWSQVTPEETKELAGRYLDTSPATRVVVELLEKRGLLEIRELRRGLSIQSFSHVGRVQVGDLSITVLPKIQRMSLLSLVRYAYELRRLDRISESMLPAAQCGFEDLLIRQLIGEVEELISRGLRRAYVETRERLSSPRGRIDLRRMALDGGTVTATLPCQHHPQTEDTLLNRVLMAGLKLAGSMANAVELRRECRRLVALMEDQVSTVRLDRTALARAERQMNRLTTAYASALSIIRLLVEAQGIVLEGESTTALPGFLFNMNAFFQALLSRFLRENLPGYSVRDERGLKGMMRYNPQFNPQRRQSPTPRPDFVVLHQGKVETLLDAKYRDLWEKPLPRDMLYQLAVYAISDRQRLQSSILYPTTNPQAREARIDISDPHFGRHLGQVCLRPVFLPFLEQTVHSNTLRARKARADYARQLVFGSVSRPGPLRS